VDTLCGMSPAARKSASPPLDLDEVRQQVSAWYAVKRQAALINDQLNKGKEALKKLVQAHGTKDEKGSFLLELEEPVGERKIVTLKNLCVTTPVRNDEAAERILRRKGLWDDMTMTVTVLNDDKVFAAYYDNLITEEELGQMFPQKVHYNFVMLDDNDKPVS
jgi:hypothetical protein